MEYETNTIFIFNSVSVIYLKITANHQTFCSLKSLSMRRGYILESAGDGGLLMVSGLKHSDGDGDLSRFVTAPKPNESPWPKLSVRLFVPPPILAECPRCALGMPSTGIPFSDKNSSRSAY